MRGRSGGAGKGQGGQEKGVGACLHRPPERAELLRAERDDDGDGAPARDAAAVGGGGEVGDVRYRERDRVVPVVRQGHRHLAVVVLVAVAKLDGALRRDELRLHRLPAHGQRRLLSALERLEFKRGRRLLHPDHLVVAGGRSGAKAFCETGARLWTERDVDGELLTGS